uniref:Uncharacterized protein n=1 Tax=Timema tahoe TaxID=61484 RepID=A0A7R9P0W0_9NEOP|nr:unnamed protein product [Timema tahoe]
MKLCLKLAMILLKKGIISWRQWQGRKQLSLLSRRILLLKTLLGP